MTCQACHQNCNSPSPPSSADTRNDPSRMRFLLLLERSPTLGWLATLLFCLICLHICGGEPHRGGGRRRDGKFRAY